MPVSDDALYESSREEKHVDVGLRYSQMYGDWDVGLSYLGGTNRDPYYRVELPCRAAVGTYEFSQIQAKLSPGTEKCRRDS